MRKLAIGVVGALAFGGGASMANIDVLPTLIMTLGIILLTQPLHVFGR